MAEIVIEIESLNAAGDGVGRYLRRHITVPFTIPGERVRVRLGPRHGDELTVSPTAFFQTNIGAAEILVRLVMEAVPAGSRVLDLYAGAGLFALPLARAGHDVVAIEENRVAVADGEVSRRLNRIPAEGCRFIARAVEDAVRTPKGLQLPSPGYGPQAFDVVILDPPRRGCDPVVLREVFGRLRPRIAVYVSCDPEALERDLKRVARQDYDIRLVQPVDMFPHTAHIETVVVLRRL